MKIIVTGSQGTIGKALTKELRQRGHQVTGVDLAHSSEADYIRADIGNFRQVEAALEDELALFGADVVYHLAAEFGRQNGEDYYEQLWRTNVIGTRNILELQRRNPFKLIFASSSEVYGEQGDDVILTEDLPITRQPNDYAISKWVNEQQILNFTAKHGNECVRLRFFNAYGPGEHYHPYRSVVCQFAHKLLNNQPITVYENYYRTFMYMGDFIPTLANVCERFKPGEVYNIAGTDYRPVKDVSDLIVKYLGRGEELIRYAQDDPTNIKSKRADISKAIRDFGHDPKTTLEDGILDTLRWMGFKENVFINCLSVGGVGLWDGKA